MTTVYKLLLEVVPELVAICAAAYQHIALPMSQGLLLPKRLSRDASLSLEHLVSTSLIEDTPSEEDSTLCC